MVPSFCFLQPGKGVAMNEDFYYFRKMEKKVFQSILFVLCCLTATGQDIVTKSLLENVHNWQEGNVTLASGQELSGLVRFDDHSGILTFENGEVSKALIAKNCAKFSFFDEELKRERYFYSLEYDDRETFSKFYFFELLRSFDEFIVLSKVDPIDVKSKSQGTAPVMAPDGSFYNPGTVHTRTEVYQTETIFLMNSRGDIEPYVQIVEREFDTLFGERKRTKNRFINKDLLESYIGSGFAQLELFAEKNDLSFRIKSDLLKILDAYVGLKKD